MFLLREVEITYEYQHRSLISPKLFDYVYSTMNNLCVKLLKGVGSLSSLSCGQAEAIQRK